MQKEQDNRILIQSYSPQGFNIDGNKVFGPCALLPPAILQWKVRLWPVQLYDVSFAAFIFSFNIHVFLPCRLELTKISQKKVSLCSTCLNQK